jgi:hypothetical protein
MADIIRMKNYVSLLFIIYILTIQNSEGSSCAFSGACLYNIQVHHCEGSAKRSLTSTGSQRGCPCSDITSVQMEQQNLSSWVQTINSTFQTLRADLTGVKAELNEKSVELAVVRDGKTKDNATLTKYVMDIQKTEDAITTERQNWFKERDRLQNELNKVKQKAQICKQASVASTTSQQGIHCLLSVNNQFPGCVSLNVYTCITHNKFVWVFNDRHVLWCFTYTFLRL